MRDGKELLNKYEKGGEKDKERVIYKEEMKDKKSR